MTKEPTPCPPGAVKPPPPPAPPPKIGAARLWRITSSHSVAGVVVENGVVIEAAPILGWALGKKWSRLKKKMEKMGWHGEVVDE